MRVTFAIVILASYVLAGIAIVLTLDRWWWFRLACSLFLFGRALSSVSFGDSLARIRRLIRLNLIATMPLMFAAYTLAGVAAVVGALASLDRAPGLIVTFFAFWWAWGWGLGLRESLRSADDCPKETP